MLRPFPAKPKWMRWKTYLQLRERALREDAEIVFDLLGFAPQA